MDWVRWTLNVCFNKHAVLQLIQHAVDLARQIPRRCAIDFSCCGIQMPIVEGIYSMEGRGANCANCRRYTEWKVRRLPSPLQITRIPLAIGRAADEDDESVAFLMVSDQNFPFFGG